MDEPNGHIIAIDSEEEGEHSKCAEAEVRLQSASSILPNYLLMVSSKLRHHWLKLEKLEQSWNRWLLVLHVTTPRLTTGCKALVLQASAAAAAAALVAPLSGFSCFLVC